MNKKKSKTANQLIPGDIFHPGEFLKEEIDARGMKQVDLVSALNLSKSEVNLIIHGKRNITVPIAIRLESLFGIDAETWMNLQIKYEIEVVKLTHKNELKSKVVSPRKRASIKRVIAAA